MTEAPALEPILALREAGAYKVPRSQAPIDLRLDGNEGAWPPEAILAAAHNLEAPTIRNYPSARALERALAARYKIDLDQVLATAGADDALDRTCRAMLEHGRESIVIDPTFEMITRYAQMTKATITRIPWKDRAPFPIEAILSQITEATRHIALVSPNNPTGEVIDGDALERIATSAPHALVVLDHAYVEFAAEHDLTELALTFPNVVVVRTMSKAWGMAGLRVGYVLGQPRVIDWLRAVGNPYAVTGPSAKIAIARLTAPEDDIESFITQVRRERSTLASALERAGAAPTDSQANFVFARHRDPVFVRDLMASQGIAVRAWPGSKDRADALRISCPGNTTQAARVERALDALSPQAILLDMDGVMVDVHASYRAAITQTCEHFGVTLAPDEIAAAKRAGDANNDWVLTRKLLANHDVEVSLEEVTHVFEDLYQGTDATPGLKLRETPLVTRAQLEALREGREIAIVTGRPLSDALDFLEREGLRDLFEVLVCMEDAPPKPAADPVVLACQKLGVQSAWMIGDTPDDMRAARAACATSAEASAQSENHSLLAIACFGMLPPSTSDREKASRALLLSGAGRIFSDWESLLEKLA